MASKKSRREYGDGSIYQRKSDSRFVGSFRTPDGSRKYVYADTRPEAKKLLEEAKQQSAAGLLVASNKQKVSEYLEYWLSVRKLKIRASTYAYHCHRARSRIAPVLGKITLQKLTQGQVQSFVNGLIDEELAPSYIRLICITLKAALDDAVRWKLLSVNPCRAATLPRVARKEMQALTVDQAQTLLAHVRNHDFECLVALALATGMRRGELLGLHWNDIDFEKSMLKVERTLIFINKIGYSETEPKTKSSKRTIVLAGFALDVLKVHRKKQVETRLQASSWGHPELVFTNVFGDWMTFSMVQRTFKRILWEAALPEMHFHNLRHSAATFLLSMGVQPKIVQEVLGHTSIAITMDVYGHVLPGMQGGAINQLDLLLTQPQKEAK